MNELGRDLRQWSNGEPNELEQRLLDAARGDHVPAALRERMASALTASITSASSAGLLKSSLLFSKAGLWGVLTLLALGGSSFYALRSTEQARAAQFIVREAPLAIAPKAVAVAAAPVTLTAPIAPTAPRSSSAGARAISQLRAEVALLDRARHALRSGASDDALDLLAQHERRFVDGALRPEAEALRIESLLRNGDRATAEQRYDRFTERYPAHPLGDRIARLLQGKMTKRGPMDSQ